MLTSDERAWAYRSLVRADMMAHAARHKEYALSLFIDSGAIRFVAARKRRSAGIDTCSNRRIEPKLQPQHKQLRLCWPNWSEGRDYSRTTTGSEFAPCS